MIAAMGLEDDTRRSWNIATRNHNRHKGDQAAFLRGGGDTLFPEELELLGPLDGVRLAHLQCNAGQDTLCLARRGARVTGVDFSDEAITFARQLAADTGMAATFVHSEVVSWLEATDQRFEVAFSSYGAAVWLPDLAAWARGIARVLEPGGRFVYVEFHPVAWSVGADLRLSRDDYFQTEPFLEPVGDYVASSGAGLGGTDGATPGNNDVVAASYQVQLGDLVTVLAGAGLAVRTLREYPYANGCRLTDALVADGDRRWIFPPGTARVPLMFGLVAEKPA
jgi:SAM-dependent methyltransferase